MEIKKQKHFPYLNNYRQKFPIDDNTIFVFEDTVYTNNKMSYDIVAHEFHHLIQQSRIGAKEWINRYLEDKDFRLEQEIDAYKEQLSVVRKMNDRQEYAHILAECGRNLSSPLYGNLITYQEAIKILKDS